MVSILANLTITDELTLATTNGHHCIDGLETGQHGLVDGVVGENTRGLDRSTVGPLLLIGLLRALTT